MKTTRSFKYWQWRVIICSMVGYALFYFVRKNFSFAMPALGEEYGITNTSRREGQSRFILRTVRANSSSNSPIPPV